MRAKTYNTIIEAARDIENLIKPIIKNEDLSCCMSQNYEYFIGTDNYAGKEETFAQPTVNYEYCISTKEEISQELSKVFWFRETQSEALLYRENILLSHAICYDELPPKYKTLEEFQKGNKNTLINKTVLEKNFPITVIYTDIKIKPKKGTTSLEAIIVPNPIYKEYKATIEEEIKQRTLALKNMVNRPTWIPLDNIMGLVTIEIVHEDDLPNVEHDENNSVIKIGPHTKWCPGCGNNCTGESVDFEKHQEENEEILEEAFKRKEHYRENQFLDFLFNLASTQEIKKGKLLVTMATKLGVLSFGPDNYSLIPIAGMEILDESNNATKNIGMIIRKFEEGPNVPTKNIPYKTLGGAYFHKKENRWIFISEEETKASHVDKEGTVEDGTLFSTIPEMLPEIFE